MGSNSNPGPDLDVVDVVVTLDDDSSAVDVDLAVAATMMPPVLSSAEVSFFYKTIGNKCSSIRTHDLRITRCAVGK